uniref:DB domain-containing protein n=1 Tax=Syphacia muris TaxID=451379 RepID=A0A0N5AR86_9BILA
MHLSYPQCIASGVCGGAGSACAPPAPNMAACQPSCSLGYQCGHYGCARRKARVHGANTFTSSRYAMKHKTPNQLFMECCENRGLPDACLAKCTFNTFTKEALTNMYFKNDACPIQASADIQFCAAQGRDHRSCCFRNGTRVTTTLAGEKCLIFCDQRPGNVTQLDMSYLSCYDRFENMKSCFWHDIVTRMYNE